MINIENFTKLAKYLRSLPDDYDRFDMSIFHTKDDLNFHEENPLNEYEVSCGTVACALGHGPAAGIAPTPRDNYWTDYCHSRFSRSVEVYKWCFDSLWAEVDNTYQGAALRIELMLKMHPEFDVIKLTEQYKDITGLKFEQ